MMEDLLAGLEASAFEGFEVSPAKQRQLPRPSMVSPSRRPLTPRRHVASQISPLRPAHPSSKMLVRPKSPCKQSPSKRTKAAPELGRAISVKVEQKVESVKPLTAPPLAQVPLPKAVKVEQPSPKDVGPVKLEDDEFDFGFDLAELANIDEKTLIESPPSVSLDGIQLIGDFLTQCRSATQSLIRMFRVRRQAGLPPRGRATPWMLSSTAYGRWMTARRAQLACWSRPPRSEAERYVGCRCRTDEQTLMVSDVKQGIRRIVHLKERWADTEVQAGEASLPTAVPLC